MAGYNLKGFVSALTIVIAHMLKWDYQPRRRTPSWRRSIDEHRARVRRGLSFRSKSEAQLKAMIERAYGPARTLAAKETGLPLSTFPGTCAYAWSEIISREHELVPLEDGDLG